MLNSEKMVQRTELESTIRRMVALDILSKPLSSLGKKAERRRDKLASTAIGLLSEQEELERVFARTETIEQEKARTLREGIAMFKKKHPRYGSVLEGMIQEKRIKKDEHLVYGITEGFTLGVAEYRSVMQDLGLSPIEADGMYSHLLEISDRLGKANQYSERTILL
jgi:hypothetical protein